MNNKYETRELSAFLPSRRRWDPLLLNGQVGVQMGFYCILKHRVSMFQSVGCVAPTLPSLTPGSQLPRGKKKGAFRCLGLFPAWGGGFCLGCKAFSKIIMKLFFNNAFMVDLCNSPRNSAWKVWILHLGMWTERALGDSTHVQLNSETC